MSQLHRASRREFLQFAGISIAGTALAACIAPAPAAPSQQAEESEAGAPATAATQVRFATDWG